MPVSVVPPAAPTLSICIATLNRAAFIGATLESILIQLTDDCEVVVLDGASTDDTERVVSEYAGRFDRLRYIKQDTNNGIDRDYDHVVSLARGEYCWLMTDDDLLKPGAVAVVLKALGPGTSLVIVNVEFSDFSMSKVLQRRWLRFESDRVYEQGEMDRLFAEVDDIAMYIGSVVVKRAVWLAREREPYYGSLFIHVGVIFQERLPGNAMVIAEPLISYRTSNDHTYSAKMTEMLFVKWPSIVESLAPCASARRKVRSAEPWRNPQWLLLLRGLGLYSLTEYRRWVRPRLSSTRETLIPIFVALLPSVAVNVFLVSYYFARQDQGRWLQAMRDSPLHPRNWRAFKRES